MLELQSIVVGLIIVGAFAFAAVTFWKKTRAFSQKRSACADDCGCGSKSKTPKIAH